MGLEPLTLSTAELAVVFQHLLGSGPAQESTLLVDLDLDEADLSAARVSLSERGFLMSNPRRSESALAPSLEPILRTVTQPQVLGVLQFTKTGEPSRTAYVSWTADKTVINRADPDGVHTLQPLASSQEVGEAVCRETGVEAFKRPKISEPANLEAIVGSASMRAVFMAVSDLTADQQHVRAASWIVSGDQLWLAVGMGAEETPRMRPAAAEDVSEAVQSLIDTAISEAVPGVAFSTSGEVGGANKPSESSPRQGKPAHRRADGRPKRTSR